MKNNVVNQRRPLCRMYGFMIQNGRLILENISFCNVIDWMRIREGHSTLCLEQINSDVDNNNVVGKMIEDKWNYHDR